MKNTEVSSSDWHPEDIKAAVRKRGQTLAGLSRSAGLSEQMLNQCLFYRVSERGDLVIANFIELPPHHIWPSRYNPDGSRLRLRKQVESKRVAA